MQPTSNAVTKLRLLTVTTQLYVHKAHSFSTALLLNSTLPPQTGPPRPMPSPSLWPTPFEAGDEDFAQAPAARTEGAARLACSSRSPARTW